MSPREDQPSMSGQAAPRARRSDSVDVRESSHMMDYLRVLSKRRWTAIAAFVLTVSAVALYTWSITPEYQATVQLMIEDERPRVVVFKDAIDQDRDQLDYQQTQVAILESRALARRTIEELKLWRDPELAGGAAPTGLARIVGKAGSIVTTLVAAISTSEKPASPPSAAPATQDAVTETPVESRVIDSFLSRLSVAPVRGTRMVRITFRAQSPPLAASIANALADAYVKQNVEFKTVQSRDAADWLGSQLEEQRKKVAASEAALQRYRDQTQSVATDTRESASVQKLSALNTALTEAKTNRIHKETLYRGVEGLQTSGATLETVPAILSNTFVQTLKAQLVDLQREQAELRRTLGERHPQMVKINEAISTTTARLNAEIGKGLDALRHDYESALAEENALAAAVESQKHEVLASQRKQTEYDALEHAVASDRQIFETLLQRTKETGVAGQSLGSNIRIIDTADVPRAPVSPRKDRNALVGLLGGLMFAVGAAFFVDYLDKSIQTPDELKTRLGLPCLGLVPIANGHDDDQSLLVSNGVPARFKEAFRVVRSNVLFASSREPVHTIVVTSSGPKEGKTTVATNLAVALAQTGQRVLLIDADMRRPSVHKALGAEQEPGLSEVTTGRAKVESVMRESSVTGLWLLSAGAVPNNPAELLSSPQLKQLLERLGQQFAWIIIDSPPVMAVADASLIANVAGAVLFVVAAERTQTPVAINALDQLDAARARFIGAVLNQVDLQHNAFFYSSYYRPEYGAYYISES